MTVGGMGFIPERLLMMMMMMIVFMEKQAGRQVSQVPGFFVVSRIIIFRFLQQLQQFIKIQSQSSLIV